MIIDYYDMVNAGLIKEASTVTKPQEGDKYAVMLKLSDGRLVGKFCITTEDDVKNSLYALECNKALPEQIKNCAGYWIKQAAEFYGIENNINAKLSPRIIDAEEIHAATTSEPVYRVKMGSITYKLETESDLATIEEDFKASQYKYPLKERQKIALAIVKQATHNSYKPSELLGRYIFPHLNEKVAKELSYRKEKVANDKYSEFIDKLSLCKDAMEPLDFLDNLRSLDKAFGFDAEKNYANYEDMLIEGR